MALQSKLISRTLINIKKINLPLECFITANINFVWLLTDINLKLDINCSYFQENSKFEMK